MKAPKQRSPLPVSLTFHLGVARVAFASNSPSLGEQVKERFALFAAPAASREWHISFFTLNPWENSLGEAPYRLVPSAGGFSLQSSVFHAQVDLREHRAVIAGPESLSPLEVVLRHLLPLLASPGLVFHGALLDFEGRLVGACGVSGAGKTTLASLAGGAALCDELWAAIPENDGFTARSLPYWQAKPGGGTLSAIVALYHADENRLKPLSPREAFQEFQRHALWPVFAPDSVADTFTALAHLVRRIPCFAFGFRPEPTAVDCLRAAASLFPQLQEVPT